MQTLYDLSRIYENAQDATPMFARNTFQATWRKLVEFQAWELSTQNGVRLSFVEGQPFENAVQMFDYIDEHKHLPISTDFNDSAINGEKGNLLFRGAHDLCHWLCDHHHTSLGGPRCNFQLDGETRACHFQTQQMLRRHAEWLAGKEALWTIQTTFSEVVLQAAYYWAHKDFAAQKVALAPIEVINGWYRQHGLAEFRVPPAIEPTVGML